MGNIRVNPLWYENAKAEGEDVDAFVAELEEAAKAPTVEKEK